MPTLLYLGQNPAAGTGSPVVVLRHLQRFAREGWAIALVAEYGADCRECAAAGWVVRQLPHRRWWWPPYRPHSAALRWMRLRLLAGDAARGPSAPDAILAYLAAHATFSGALATHVARATGAPLHLLVHDDPAAFPSAHGREARVHREHEAILRGADVCWFASPELAQRFPGVADRARLLYPLPEGWDRPARWRPELAQQLRLYYAGHVWPAQVPLLGRIARTARMAGGELVLVARPSEASRALADAEGVRCLPAFPSNAGALEHLAANASAVLVSYAEGVSAMPWCATSFPSKLVEYCHLGVPLAVVAPADAAVARWAARVGYRHVFDPAGLADLAAWLDGLRRRDAWEARANDARQLALTEFDPVRIHATLAAALRQGTESRAA